MAQPPTFGDSIRQWREGRRLTRDEVAAACHTTYASIANWELDRSKPSGAAAKILDDLMAGRIALIPLTDQEARLLDEAVERGKFKSRLDAITDMLLNIIHAEGAGAPGGKIERFPKDNLRVAEGD